MAFLQTQFHSKALNLCVTCNVLMPVSDTPAAQRKVPVLYLLHGYSDDHSIWLRRTSIERYLEDIAPDFAIVMPAVDHSRYTDEKHGNKYWTYVSEELPQVMGSLFPLSDRREDTFVAGLSMGGYGTLKLALNQLERFLAAAAFSGGGDATNRLLAKPGEPGYNQETFDVYGSMEEYVGSINDLKHRAAVVAKLPVKPALALHCGTDDFLFDSNVAYHEYLNTLGYDHIWEATPGYAHEWRYWDLKVQEALRWFVALRNEATGGRKENTRPSANF